MEFNKRDLELLDIINNLSDIEFNTMEISIEFGIRTHFNTSNICSILLNEDLQPVYQGRTKLDFILDISEHTKDLIPDEFIIEKSELDLSYNNDGKFQYVDLVLQNSAQNELFFLMNTVYINSIDNWLKVLNLFVINEAKKLEI